jgi:regulator of sirC expression with transglutaminase-like and TPR domain
LNKYLFEVNGFHGSRADYYSRSNSYVNEVLDDREGLPITLSLIYMELGRRIGLSIVGIGLPGHFVVRHEPAEGEGHLIDVFEAAAPLSVEEAKARVALAGLSWKDDYLKPVAKRDMLVRMLHNLRGAAGGSEDAVALLRYLDAILSISPDSAEDRWRQFPVR